MAAAGVAGGGTGLRPGGSEYLALTVHCRDIAVDLLRHQDLGKNSRSDRAILLSDCRELRQGGQHVLHSLDDALLVQRGVIDQAHDVFLGRLRGQVPLFQAGVEDHAESRQDRQEDQQEQPKP